MLSRVPLNGSQVSPNSSINCCFKWRRAVFFMARRAAAIASFSACRSFRVRLSKLLGKCETFGRCAPTFRSFGFAYGFIYLVQLGTDFREENRKFGVISLISWFIDWATWQSPFPVRFVIDNGLREVDYSAHSFARSEEHTSELQSP